jgi:type I restriction enzyme S subunit
LYYCCNSDFFQKSIISNASKTTLPILNKSKFGTLIIPLPPLAEQKRIVAKIEELMSSVEKLKSKEV